MATFKTWQNGLSMFAEFEKLPYLYEISVSARFHKPCHLLLWDILISKGSSTDSAPSINVQIQVN